MNAPFVWPDSAPPLVLVGPTATGKTDAALVLAERIGGEIINCDSMQVYRGMDIGTAKPAPQEQARVPFHLLDVVPPDTAFTVSDWKERCETAMQAILSRSRRVLICGGTGLYIRALLDNWSLAQTPADEAIRAELREELILVGPRILHAQLAEVDAVTAERLHPNDGVRITRALEVYRATGTPISVFQAADRAAHSRRNALLFGLDLPRPALYERIEARVDRMLAAGFVEEVRGLLNCGYVPALGPMKSLGYKEIVQYLHGEVDLSDAVSLIKQNTRRFAKRQQTWFRADKSIIWLDVSELSSVEVAARIMEYLP